MAKWKEIRANVTGAFETLNVEDDAVLISVPGAGGTPNRTIRLLRCELRATGSQWVIVEAVIDEPQRVDVAGALLEMDKKILGGVSVTGIAGNAFVTVRHSLPIPESSTQDVARAIGLMALTSFELQNASRQ